MVDKDIIMDENDLNRAAKRLSLRFAMDVTAGFTSPIVPEITYTISDDGLTLGIPDYLIGMSYDDLGGLVAHILDPSVDPVDLSEFISSPSFLSRNRTLLRDRTDLRGPRKGRDLKACFYRCIRKAGADIPEPMLGWSDRIPMPVLSSKVLGAIIFHTDLMHRSREELDDMMNTVLIDWEVE